MMHRKPHINAVVLGHVDSGKSTTCGHLLIQIQNQKLPSVSFDRMLKENERKATEIGKETYKFAWLMDRFTKERELGMTIDCSKEILETMKYKVGIIDCPGHRDFMKNMITGTSQADFAILLVSGAKGEYEAGLLPTGQTREHATLAYALGIKQIIVCVNKMDEYSVSYSQERFQQIAQDVSILLKTIGYKNDGIQYIPISGWKGDNLVQLPTDTMPWYLGVPLIKAIDNIQIHEFKRQTDKPLRLTVSDVYKIGGIGTVPVGIVHSGYLKPGQNLKFGPNGPTSECCSVEMFQNTLEYAQPGDTCGFNIKSVSVKDIHRGMVVGEAKNDPPREAESFEAQIIIFDHPNQIKQGYKPIFNIHTCNVACEFTEIKQKIDRRNGTIIQTQLNQEITLKKGDSAIVKLTPSKPIVVESFVEYPQLGRFVFRDNNRLVGAGVIKSVQKKK